MITPLADAKRSIYTPLYLLIGPEVHETLKHARLGMPLAGREKQRVPRGSPFSRELSLAPSGTVGIHYQQTWVKVPPLFLGMPFSAWYHTDCFMTSLYDKCFFSSWRNTFCPGGSPYSKGTECGHRDMQGLKWSTGDLRSWKKTCRFSFLVVTTTF